MNYISIIVSVLSILATIASLIYAVYCNKRAKRKERDNQSVKWTDLPVAAQDMAKKIKHEFLPEVIYAPSEKSGILIRLLKTHWDMFIPSITGFGMRKDDYTTSEEAKIINRDNNYHSFVTSKWRSYIPKQLFEYKDKKLLIVDDFAKSGDFIDKLIDVLVQKGFQRSNIKVFCLATHEVAIDNRETVDFYWRKTQSSIYMPWGKTE